MKKLLFLIFLFPLFCFAQIDSTLLVGSQPFTPQFRFTGTCASNAVYQFYNPILRKYSSLGGAGAAWGSITGTLSAQTDLNTALGLKAPLNSPTFTGTPSLPTGAFGVTQTFGNNTTALATTAFVQAAIPGGLTFNSGLTKTGSTVTLGGSFLNTTTLNTNGFDFALRNSGGEGVFFYDSSNTISLFGADPSLSQGSFATFSPTTFSIGFQYYPGDEEFTFNSTSMIVGDGTNGIGLVNGGDFEANFVARSLVTKQYVTSVTSGLGTGTVHTISGVAANGFTWSIANPTTTPAITLTLQNATTAQSGQLTSTDWNTFNGKQASGSYLTAVGIATANGFSGSSSGGLTPNLTIVAGAITPTSTNGVSAATMAFNDATSSIQTQLNSKAALTGLKVNNASLYNAYGDSFTYGVGSSTFANDYVNLFGAYLNLTVFNYSLGGTGAWYSTGQNNIQENPGQTAFTSVMTGFNDVRRNGSAAATLAKIDNGYTAIFANHFLNSYSGANSGAASIVLTGSWSTYNAVTAGGKSTLGATSSTNGNHAVYSFSGTNVVVAMIGADGSVNNYGTFSVSIDGGTATNYVLNGQTDGISDGTNANDLMPYVLIFSGLADIAHTVTVTNTSSLPVPIDYFGVLNAPVNTTPLLVMEIPKMTATGYAVSPANASDAVMNTANAAIEATVASWPTGYPVYVDKVNNYWTPYGTGDLYSDNVHPTDAGYRLFLVSCYSSFPSSIQNNSYKLTNGTGILPLNYTQAGGMAGIDFTGSYTWSGKQFFTATSPSTAALQISATSGNPSSMTWFRSGYASWYMGSPNNSPALDIAISDNAFATPLVNMSNGGFGINGVASTPLQVSQYTTGIGTIAVTATLGTVTGTGTNFTIAFKVGQTITANSETHTITAISSNTAMTTDVWTNTFSGAYTLAGGTRFQVYGNGMVAIGGTAPTAMLDVPASVAGYSALRLRSGVDPTTNNSGDIWSNTGVIKYYDGATIQTFANLAGTQAFTNKDLTGAGNTFPTFNQNTTGSAGSVANALTATDATLTFSGSYNGATARTVGINLANANTWTAKQAIQMTTNQLSLNYDASHVATFTVGSTGTLTITPTSTQTTLTGILVTTSSITDQGALTVTSLSTFNGGTLFALAQKIGITEGSGGRVGQVALVAGTVAVTISGLTTSSRAFLTRVISNTTSLTTGYNAVCTSNTLTITADVSAGTINTADISTLNYLIVN
jgi:lysophospholipase L1-like esterase